MSRPTLKVHEASSWLIRVGVNLPQLKPILGGSHAVDLLPERGNGKDDLKPLTTLAFTYSNSCI